MDVIPGEECFQVLVGIKCETPQRQELKYISDAARIRHGCDPKTGERVNDEQAREVLRLRGQLSRLKQDLHDIAIGRRAVSREAKDNLRELHETLCRELVRHRENPSSVLHDCGDGDCEQTADCCGPVSVVADRDEELERFNERKSAKGAK